MRASSAPEAGNVRESEPTVRIDFAAEEVEALKKVLVRNSSKIEGYPNLLLTTAFTYLIALLDAFLLDVFAAASSARPETLRSRKQLTYEDALSFVASTRFSRAGTSRL